MKYLCSLLVIAVVCVSLSAGAHAAAVGEPNFDISAKGVYLYNLDTDLLIYEKNADEPMYPASLTKIMTCILALEKTGDLDKEMLTYPNYIQDYLYNYQYVQGNGGVSTGGLLAGQELPMRELLYALMLPSANEAAMIIADHLAGSQESFADMMNARARELGCTGTSFVNPNGLFDARHVTTPRDMALLTQHAMDLPGFMEIVSTTTRRYTPSGGSELVWETTNQMMVEKSSYYYPALRGVKTGTLPESGYCFVSTATRDGFTYLLVVMGAPITDSEGKTVSQNTAFAETQRLYDWVFDTYKRKSLVERGKYVKEIPLRLSMDKDFLQLMTADRFTALVPNSVEASSVTMKFDIPESVDAPVKKGDLIGKVTLVLAGEEIGEVELLAAESVSASTLLLVLEKVRAVVGSFWFKFAIIFILLLIAFYVVMIILRNRGRRKSGYRPRRRL